MALAHVRAGEPNVDAQAPQVLDLLARHLVGDHQHQAVALQDAHLRQAQARVARGGLHDGPAGLQPAVGLRGLDHGAGDPILDRAPRIGALQLGEQAARAGVEGVRQLQHRRAADQVERGGYRRRDGGGIASAGGHGGRLLEAGRLDGADGGTRTHTTRGPQILSLRRIPFRHVRAGAG